MSCRKKIVFIVFITLFFVQVTSLYGKESSSSNVEKLFWNRQWSDLETFISSDLPAKDLSLIANAMWLQGRWEDSLKTMDMIGDRYPSEVVPYVNMLRVLGNERTGRVKEAYSLALAMYKSDLPAVLDYYVAYALSRLTGNREEKRKWLRRMPSMTFDKNLKRKALKQLMNFPAPSLSDASAMLKVSPGDKKALAIFKKASPSRERSYRLGYAAYLAGNYSSAVSYLSTLPIEKYYGQSAAYYRGMSLYRLKRYRESLKVFSRLLLLEKSDYVIRSSRRISILAGRGLGKECADVFLRASKQLKGVELLRVRYSYMNLLKGNSRKRAEDNLLKEFPGSNAAISVLWRRAWGKLDAGEYLEALSLFRSASTALKGRGRSELHYWAGICLDRLGRLDEAAEQRAVLGEKYPLTIYSFLSFPGGSMKLVNGVGGVKEGDDVLSQWGFVSHAMMNLMSSKNPSDRLTAARLARWMGHEEEAFRAARPLEKFVSGPEGLSRELMEYLYPRPYRKTVESAAARYKVEPYLIWAIMRQESAFDPSAGSWVGASGLMQLMPATAASEARSIGLKSYSIFSVRDNILMGTSHIARLLKSYKKTERAVAAYNAGSGNVNRWNRSFGDKPFDLWMEEIPFSETRGYVKRVMANLFVYRVLYGD